MTEGAALNAALAAAAVAAAGGAVAVFLGRAGSLPARVAAIHAGVFLAAALALRWRDGGHVPLASQYESLVFLAFCAAWAVPLRRAARAWALLLAGLAVVLLVGLASLVRAPARPLMPALQSNWLLVHVAVTMASYGAFVLSALASTWTLLRGRVGGPPEEELDGFASRAIGVGFLLLALGIITGAVWANEAWGAWWSWDPKETWALITWILYGVAMHLRRVRAWRGARFAWINLAGFSCVVFTYFGVNYLLSGLHSYAG